MGKKLNLRSLVTLVGLLAMALGPVGWIAPATPARADHTPPPTSVTIAGSLQPALGCAGDWDPACAATHLAYEAGDDVWQGTFGVPAGSWEYKAALNDSWDENYGAGGVQNGPNIPLSLLAQTSVKFYYDHKTHWITDNQGSTIATAPGSYQPAIGCPGDWQPDCLRSWLQDPDGDGVYSLTTTAIPPGNYEFKVAIDESWDVNYGAGGVQNGPNLPFSVVDSGSTVTFSFDSASHMPGVTVQGTQPAQDNNVWWDGLRHDSRDTLYRTPGGAVPAGTPVIVRFRTFHNDVTSVQLRVYDINTAGQRVLPMSLAAEDVSCYQADLEGITCDFWAVTLPNAAPNNLWYRFIVSDGSDTDYYDDNTAALDGGLGAPSEEVEDNSYALMVYEPSFTTPAWTQNAVIYQIFPDRFFNGRLANDPETGDPRYDDPILALPWGTLPEGYCRNYADGATHCPWRFDDTPPDSSPAVEQPRGRDYFGGDLKGVTIKLGYLKNLGVTAIYFNPIFFARSNHRYDTAGYYQIDPALGTLEDFQNLVYRANRLGIRVILDGVFNHLSSDSPFFDRYHHYPEVGACESANSPYRAWFYFHDVAPGTGSCVDSQGVADAATYDGWFGFDSIPVIKKDNPEVQDYFLYDSNSVTRYWLQQGAAGWRMDVSGDPSFPSGYWEGFRGVVKGADPNALLISETWQKDSTLLRMLRGDRFDTTMNYRLRDAVIGLLAPGPFDSKGFADSGRVLAPSEFASRILSIREDTPAPAYYSMMNLLDSHDTERLRWTLTPGAETTAEKELNTANVAEGLRRQKIAALIQFTLPGAPTVYYGDEAGLTGDDDPDDRRTFPWGAVNADLWEHYRTLSALHFKTPSLVSGDLRVLLADDAAGAVAYVRKMPAQATLMAINRGDGATLTIPVAGTLPDGLRLYPVYTVENPGLSSVTVTGGLVTISLDRMSAVVLTSQKVDLQAPAAPANLQVTAEGNGAVDLAWEAVEGAAGYNVYRSPLTGGGYIKVNSDLLAGTTFTDTGLRNASNFFYVVTALDAAGNESGYSNEVAALPHLTIGWANLQHPSAMGHTISAVDRTDNAYGQVWIDGVTNLPGPTPSLRAQLGFGPEHSNPAGNPDWVWVEAAFNVDAGNNDEFVASMLPDAVTTYDYVYRYTTTGGRDWLYADINGPIPAGDLPTHPGKLTVMPGGDYTPPVTPTGLRVVTASPGGIELAWDPVTGDHTFYGYEVSRSDVSGGPYSKLALVTGAGYVDTAVVEGTTYFYVVRSVDLSFNRSPDSAEISATPALRTVTVVFTVTVPDSTDATGRSVYIAGTLSRLDGGLPDWNPGEVVLTRLDATHWTITLTGKESTPIEYKYTLGDWEHVEKGAACDELGNRPLTLSYGTNGTMQVSDTVLNWRNVAPCGN
jgi:glycosidase